MSTSACPHCGHEQDAGTSCLRCGIIFERYWNLQKGSGRRKRRAQSAVVVYEARRQALWIRILGRAGAAAVVVLLAVALWPSPPSYSVRSAAAEGRSEVKIERYLSAMSRGQTASLELSQNELNAWISERLSELNPPVESDAVAVEETGSSYRNIRQIGIELEEGLVKTHLRLSFYSLPITLELEGRLRAEEGILLLEPSQGRVGRLPLWPGAMKIAVRGLIQGSHGMRLVRVPATTNLVTITKGRIYIHST